MNNFSRRGFLRTSGLVAAGATFNIVPARVLGQNAPSKRIVMGMIGVGSQGSGNMGQFLGLSDVVVRAVCDVNQRRLDVAKKRVDGHYKNNDCLIIKDFRELCARPDIDAVMIATPDHWHAVIGCHAARSGKDIFGEKPFTHDLREGRALVEAVRQHGRIWQTGSWQRSTDNFRRAVELVRNGRIGKVSRIEVGLPSGGRGKPMQDGAAVPEGLDWDFWLGPAPYRPFQGIFDWDWRWVLDWGGGQMMDWIGHHGDIAQWGLNRELTGPVEFEGHGLFKSDGIYDAPTSYRFTCRYADGVEMVVADAAQLEKGMGTRWFGENGQWVYVTRGGNATSDPQIWNQRPEPGEFRLPDNGGHMREFIDCVKSRRVTCTPAEVAHRSASIGHLGQIAMLTGRRLRWNPDTEQIIGDPAASAMLGRAPRGPWTLG